MEPHAVKLLRDAQAVIESQKKNTIIVDVIQGKDSKRTTKWAYTCSMCPGNHGISSTRHEAQKKSMIHYNSHKQKVD